MALDDGSVLIPEIESGNVVRVSPEGQINIVARCGGGCNGSALGPDGHLYVCNDGGLGFKTVDGIRFPFELAPGNEGGTLQRVNITTGEVDDVYTHCDGQRLGGLNDIVFDTTGRFYFVDTGSGAIRYATIDGTDIRTVADGMSIPNGFGLSPDGKQAFASETYTRHIFRWDVAASGDLTNKTCIYTATEHGFDGLCIDGAGHVCASNLEASGVSIIAPDGTLVGTVTVPEYDSYVTNICFGGPEGRTAYITSAGRGALYATEWAYPGLRLNFAR